MSTFHWPTLSYKEPVVPDFASVCSWSGGVYTSCCINVALGFVATQCTVVFVAHAVAVGGAKPALDPLLIDGCLQLRDAAVKGLFFVAEMVLRPALVPPPLPLLMLLLPPVEESADLSSVMSFLISLCWLLEDLVSWLRVP